MTLDNEDKYKAQLDNINFILCELDLKLWNKFGLTSNNGTVTLSILAFSMILAEARKQD